MKAIILLNGEPYEGKIDASGAYVYCCDGAYEWAKDKVRIDENLGDFDSLSYVPEPPPTEIFSSEKNFTDGEIALMRAVKRGATEIEIYGGGGKREDHFLGNLHLLYAALSFGVRAVMYNNNSLMFAGTGKVLLNGFEGQTLSIVPFGGNAHIIESSGLKYPLCELDLLYGSTRGISNVAVSGQAHILTHDRVLVLVNGETPKKS